MASSGRDKVWSTGERLEALDRSLEVEDLRLVSASVSTSDDWENLGFKDTDLDFEHEIVTLESDLIVFRISIELVGLVEPDSKQSLFDVKATYLVKYRRSESGFIGNFVRYLRDEPELAGAGDLPVVSEALARRYSQSYAMALVGPRFRNLLDRIGNDISVGYIPFTPWQRSPLRYVEVLNEMTALRENENRAGAANKAPARKAVAKKAPAKKAGARRRVAKSSESE
jgi:hypothetical protein